MPEMDGFETVQSLRRQKMAKNIVIIALSASAFNHHQYKSLEAGCNDFIAKPVQLEALLACLEKHLHLQWLYEPKHSTTVVDKDVQSIEKITVTFTPKQAKKLFDFVKVGDINGICDYMATLEKQEATLKPLTDKVIHLAKNIAMRAIRDIAKKQMNDSIEHDKK